MNANETSDNEKLKEIYITTLWFENNSDKPIQLYVEPWGDNHEIPPKGFVRIVGRGPKSGCPVISQNGMDFVYSAWAGSVYAVYLDGELISGWDLDSCPPEPSRILNNKFALDNLLILKGSSES
jgi:hypothetical protein